MPGRIIRILGKEISVEFNLRRRKASLCIPFNQEVIKTRVQSISL